MGDLTPDERERFEERAGIAEFDGGLTRAQAEALARREIMEARAAAHVARYKSSRRPQ